MDPECAEREEALVDQLIERTELLLAAREDIRALERLKRNFVTLMSHELRTPLTSIVGMSELILGGFYDDFDELRDMVQTVHDEGLRLNAFADATLKYLQLEAGARRLESTVVLLEQQVNEAVGVVRQRWKGKDLKIVQHIERVHLLADSSLLREAFERVLDNACKFSPPGGTVELATSVLRRRDGQRWLTLTVTDHGEGIAPERLPDTFRLFALSHSYDHHTRGWGVGLAFVRQVMRLHGGTVQLFSEGPGRGCQVDLALPVLTRKEEDAEVAAAAGCGAPGGRL